MYKVQELHFCDSSRFFKIVHLDSLGMYFDTDEPDIRAYHTTDEFTKHMRDMIEAKKGDAVSAVLKVCNPRASLTQQAKANLTATSTFTTPKVVLLVEVEAVNASIHQKQMRRAADAWRMIKKWKRKAKVAHALIQPNFC